MTMEKHHVYIIGDTSSSNGFPIVILGNSGVKTEISHETDKQALQPLSQRAIFDVMG